MKVALVAPSPVPFVVGGAERFNNGLVEAISQTTPHLAELIKLPSRELSLPDLMANYRAFHELDLSHFDLVISSKYPAWMVPHPNHVVYMLHVLRGLYDTYGASDPSLPVDAHGVASIDRLAALAAKVGTRPDALFDLFDSCLQQVGPDHPAMAFPGPLARSLVHRLDAFALDPTRVRKHFAISRRVAERPGYFPAGVGVGVAIPPSNLTEFRCERFADFFTASRLDGPKRVDLLIAAMRHVPGDTRLLIAGNGPDRPRLEQLAADDPRIVFLGFVSDAELLTHYANALAVPFVPADEDLGLITLEAQRSGKAVITCVDSGGPTELIEDGVSGWIVEPTPEALGTAMASFVLDVDLARRMGDAGRRTAEGHTWERVVQSVLTPPVAEAPTIRSGAPIPRTEVGTTDAARRRPRPKVLVLSTYPFDPATGGGRLRCKWLLSHLARTVDVHVIALDSASTAHDERELAPGFLQTVLPKSARQRAMEGQLGAVAPIPITDIADAMYAVETLEYVTTVGAAARTADALILAQPYLMPVAQLAAPELPLVYDSQNAEYHLKDQVLRACALDDELRRVVREVESDAVRSAELVVYCSADDRPLLEALGPTLADWALVPNGADARGTTFVTGPARSHARRAWLDRLEVAWPMHGYERVALFVASHHPPNNEAAEQIMAMASDLPDILFVHVGSHCGHFERWVLPPNVVLAGVVPVSDLHQYLALADVALNPMMTGSGTNLKLLEALAAGTPVVATPLGVRGIAVEHERDLLLASVAEFPDAIRRTFDDPETPTRAERARRLVERLYDWQVLGRHFADAVLPVIRA